MGYRKVLESMSTSAIMPPPRSTLIMPKRHGDSNCCRRMAGKDEELGRKTANHVTPVTSQHVNISKRDRNDNSNWLGMARQDKRLRWEAGSKKPTFNWPFTLLLFTLHATDKLYETHFLWYSKMLGNLQN